MPPHHDDSGTLGAINNIEVADGSGVFTVGIRHYRPSDREREDDYRLLPGVKAVSA